MHWAQMQEAGGLAGMRFLLRIYRIFGRWPFRFLLFFVLLWFYARRRIAREASRDYLQRLYAFSHGATPAPTSRNVFRHFLAYSEILLDKLLAMTPSDPSANHRFDGIEWSDALRARGGIFVTAHIGNIELCRKLREHDSGMRLAVLAYTKNASRFTRLMKERNPDYDVDMIQVDDIGVDTAILLAQRIEAGGFVVLTGDRVPMGSATATVQVSFLGHETHFPISPYVLAAALQCPLYAVFGTRRSDGFVVTLRQIAESIALSRRNREAAIAPYAAAFAEMLEAECLKAPLQWSNFYPFWALPPPPRPSPTSGGGSQVCPNPPPLARGESGMS